MVIKEMSLGCSDSHPDVALIAALKYGKRHIFVFYKKPGIKAGRRKSGSAQSPSEVAYGPFGGNCQDSTFAQRCDHCLWS